MGTMGAIRQRRAPERGVEMREYGGDDALFGAGRSGRPASRSMRSFLREKLRGAVAKAALERTHCGAVIVMGRARDVATMRVAPPDAVGHPQHPPCIPTQDTSNLTLIPPSNTSVIAKSSGERSA